MRGAYPAPVETKPSPAQRKTQNVKVAPSGLTPWRTPRSRPRLPPGGEDSRRLLPSLANRGRRAARVVVVVRCEARKPAVWGGGPRVSLPWAAAARRSPHTVSHSTLMRTVKGDSGWVSSSPPSLRATSTCGTSTHRAGPTGSCDCPTRPGVHGSPAAQWWPPAMLEPAWVHAHADDFDVMHVHFGFDAESPDALRRAVSTRCAGTASRSCCTVHDLRNPHHQEPRAARRAARRPGRGRGRA